MGEVNDLFDRANANPLNTNWAACGNSAQCQLSASGVFATVGGQNISRYTGATFNNDQAASGTISAGGTYMGVALRCDTVTQTVYMYRHLGDGTAGNELSKIVSGSGPTALATSAFTGNKGDTLLFSAGGTKLLCFYNGVFAISATDTAVTAGAAGVYARNTGSNIVDNWWASGTAAAAAAFPTSMRRRMMGLGH